MLSVVECRGVLPVFLMVWTGIQCFVLLMIETLVVARSMRAFDPPRASA
jgi:hypothetical protein